MTDRILRAFAYGIGGTIVGFYVAALLAMGFEWYFTTNPNFQTIGVGAGFIAVPFGLILGFTFGAMFGFRERRPKG